MEYWFMADPHLGHDNILKLCRRDLFLTPGEIAGLNAGERVKVSRESTERHDAGIIANINRLVKPDDKIWFLGDFCWGGRGKAKEYLDRINCKNVHLVYGNHDDGWENDKYDASKDIGPLFKRASMQCGINANGQYIWLNHMPCRSWDKSFHGSWHLYGHVHGRMKHLDDADPCLLAMDVGVDPLRFMPISLSQLRVHFRPKEEAFQARKRGLTDKSTVDWA